MAGVRITIRGEARLIELHSNKLHRHLTALILMISFLPHLAAPVHA